MRKACFRLQRLAPAAAARTGRESNRDGKHYRIRKLHHWRSLFLLEYARRCDTYALMTKTIPSIVAGVLAAIAMICAVPARAQEQPMHPVPKQACLAPATWYTLAGDRPRTAPARELLADVASRDIVMLGEQHDDAGHHQWQLQTLAALHVLRPQMVIGFESFPRRVQPVLDRWIAGELTVKQLNRPGGKI